MVLICRSINVSSVHVIDDTYDYDSFKSIRNNVKHEDYMCFLVFMLLCEIYFFFAVWLICLVFYKIDDTAHSVKMDPSVSNAIIFFNVNTLKQIHVKEN